MISPLRPCSARCPGWRIARSRGRPVIVHRCEACWEGEPLPPLSAYFQAHPTCIAALNRAKARALVALTLPTGQVSVT